MIDFVWKVKKSFKKVRNDIEDFKRNSNEWVVFLDNKSNEMEERLDKIENRMDRLEEAMFKVLSMR